MPIDEPTPYPTTDVAPLLPMPYPTWDAMTRTRLLLHDTRLSTLDAEWEHVLATVPLEECWL